jgi:L-asparaginases, type II
MKRSITAAILALFIPIILTATQPVVSDPVISTETTKQAEAKPRIVILATGGTIAGSAASATQASYRAGVLSIEQILASVPGLENIAELKGIQVCNISSQNMEQAIWLKLQNTIDSLFKNNLCDGVVITHGTDTMEETAYFLHLTVRHSLPIVIVGSMRPATSLSADGPFNLYNAVALAAAPDAKNRGVMMVMNDYILSADDATKEHTVNPNAFGSPNYGHLGYMRDGDPVFFRESRGKNTFSSEFNISGHKELPKVEIVMSYAFASSVATNALVDSNVDGLVISGVGHGNYNTAIAEVVEKALSKGIAVVRSSRILKGGVDLAAEEYEPRVPVAFYKSPQKARILLMLALTKTKDPREIQRIMMEY